MNDTQKTVDLDKLREEIERAKALFSDPEEAKKRKKAAAKRFRKRYGYDGKTK